jgi:hypothetical protein
MSTIGFGFAGAAATGAAAALVSATVGSLDLCVTAEAGLAVATFVDCFTVVVRLVVADDVVDSVAAGVAVAVSEVVVVSIEVVGSSGVLGVVVGSVGTGCAC